MPRLLVINNAILFLCCSIYVGAGVSLVFFQIPLEPKLTVDNYHLIFVEPVRRATDFLTYMTIVMLVCGAIMLVTEWLSGLRWIPVAVLSGIIATTLMTIYLIFPLNEALNAGITNPDELKVVFHEWAGFNRIRASIWMFQWSAMMYYFCSLACKARANR